MHANLLVVAKAIPFGDLDIATTGHSTFFAGPSYMVLNFRGEATVSAHLLIVTRTISFSGLDIATTNHSTFFAGPSYMVLTFWGETTMPAHLLVMTRAITHHYGAALAMLDFAKRYNY